MDVKKFDISRLSGNRSFDPTQIGYEDSIEIIEDELQNTRKSFVKIGWYLKHIDEEGMYRQDGYEDIYEFAHARFKMSEGTANRFINICKQFSVNHDSPELDERYQRFEASQLFELLPMKEAEREEISPDMTIKQIREKKTENKAQREPSEELVEMFLKIRYVDLSEFHSVPELKEFLVYKFGRNRSGGGPDPNYECTPRGIRLEDYDEITWLAFARKAWNLKASNPPKAHGLQNTESHRNPDSPDPSGPDAACGMATADQAAGSYEEVTVSVSGGKGAVPEDPYRDPAVLRKYYEACSLSQKLCEGFRISSQNSTLSEIGKYAEWASKLNNIVHALNKWIEEQGKREENGISI